MEISPEAVEWAKQKAVKENVKANFKVGDIIELDGFKDNYFDFVYDGGVSYYVCGESRKLFFKNVNRVTKNNGFFFVSGQHSDEKPNIAAKNDLLSWDPLTRTILRYDKPWGCFPLSKVLLSEVKDAGFKIIKYEIKKDEYPNDPLTYGGSITIDCLKV